MGSKKKRKKSLLAFKFLEGRIQFGFSVSLLKCILYICVCTTCTPVLLGGQKWASEPLALEVQVVGCEPPNVATGN